MSTTVRMGLSRGFLVAGLCMLTACASGSGLPGGGSYEAPPAPGERTAFTYSDEYRTNYGLAMIKADAAYGRGATGLGVTVAVIDTGIDLKHPDLQGRIDPRSRDIVADRPGGATVQDEHGHGTAVAGVIAASLNGNGMHGVAYDSRVLAVRTDAPGDCGPGCQMTFSDLARAIDYAVAQNVDIINLSIGAKARASKEFEAALGRAAQAGILVVAAAGNASGSDPEWPGRYATEPFMRGTELVVGAVRSDGTMASYSNRAGASADRYLLAPGSVVPTTKVGGDLGYYNGTSFAAPHVAGAAALVLDHAPHLTAKQVADILLSTATSHGDPSQYGRGLLNIEKALAPVGDLTVPLGTDEDGTSADLADSGLAVAAAFGDAAEAWDAPVLALDAYGRPYTFSLAATLGRIEDSATVAGLIADRPARPAPLGADEAVAFRAVPGSAGRPAGRLNLRAGTDGIVSLAHGDGIGRAFGLAADTAGVADFAREETFATPHLAFAPAERSAVYSHRAEGAAFRVGAAHGSGGGAFAGEFAPVLGAVRLSLQGGAVVENGALLGGRGAGALDLGRSATSFGAVQVATPVAEGISVVGQVGIGRSTFGGAGLIRDGHAVSSGFGLGVVADDVWRGGDRLGLAVAQPLRVEDGAAALSLPVARTVAGEVVREERRFHLEPSGRQVDLEVSYRTPVGEQGSFGASALISLQPGHEADAAPKATLGLRYRTRF